MLSKSGCALLWGVDATVVTLIASSAFPLKRHIILTDLRGAKVLRIGTMIQVYNKVREVL